MRETVEMTDVFKGASFLCNGAELVEVKALGKNTVIFTFEAEDIYRMEVNYGRGEMLVNPAELRERLNLLRDLMFQKLREYEYGQTLEMAR